MMFDRRRAGRFFYWVYWTFMFVGGGVVAAVLWGLLGLIPYVIAFLVAGWAASGTIGPPWRGGD